MIFDFDQREEEEEEKAHPLGPISSSLKCV